MKTVKIHLPDEAADALEHAAADGGFASTSEFVVAAIGDLIASPRSSMILMRWIGMSRRTGRRCGEGMRASRPKKRASI
jgi:Arc/MetJ-type ribon-helix-helix transcriptional regulator